MYSGLNICQVNVKAFQGKLPESPKTTWLNVCLPGSMLIAPITRLSRFHVWTSSNSFSQKFICIVTALLRGCWEILCESFSSWNLCRINEFCKWTDRFLAPCCKKRNKARGDLFCAIFQHRQWEPRNEASVTLITIQEVNSTSPENALDGEILDSVWWIYWRTSQKKNPARRRVNNVWDQV